MLIKYVGRASPWKGKTLYNIACNLKNRGVGRVVERWSFSQRYPEKCYYRLTTVEPDPTDPEFLRGSAWGIKVFRGHVGKSESKIDAGNRADWRLIPKQDEEEFCKITSVHRRQEFPLQTDLPPLLTALYKQHFHSNQLNEEPISVKSKIHYNSFIKPNLSNQDAATNS